MLHSVRNAAQVRLCGLSCAVVAGAALGDDPVRRIILGCYYCSVYFFLSGGGEDGVLLESENADVVAGFLLFLGFFVSRFDFC